MPLTNSLGDIKLHDALVMFVVDQSRLFIVAFNGTAISLYQ